MASPRAFRAAHAAMVLLLYACTSGSRVSQRTSADVRSELLERTFPLDSADSPSDTDFAPLSSIVGNAELVLVGEPQHGSHEPLAMRNRIIRYLVAHGGLTAVSLESGLPESEVVARYVDGGPQALPADSARAAARSLTWGFSRFGENVELLRWLRAWNDDRSHAQKIRFYGYDLSLGGPALIFPKPTPINQALDWLGERDGDAASRLREDFAPMLRVLPDSATKLDDVARAALGRVIDSMVATIVRTPAATSSDGDARKAWALRTAITAQQSHQMMLVSPMHGGSSMPREAWRSINARDSAMAENVKWVMQREGPNGRVLAFAHDDHVKRVPSEGGNFAALTQRPHVMGEYLNRSLGGRMAVIGMSYGDSITVKGTNGVPSLDSALALVRRPPYLLSLSRHSAKKGASDDWFARKWAMRVNRETFVLLAPSAAFDAMVVLGGVSRAR